MENVVERANQRAREIVDYDYCHDIKQEKVICTARHMASEDIARETTLAESAEFLGVEPIKLVELSGEDRRITKRFTAVVIRALMPKQESQPF